jgi:hypothetical protein
MAKAKLKEEVTMAAEIIDRLSGDIQGAEPSLVRLAMQGWEIQKQMAALEEALKPIKADLQDALQAGSSLVVKGVCRVVVSEAERVSIGDADRLAGVLGDRFADLVKTESVYKPEPRLVEMACDGDEPLSPAIRACLKVGKSTSVKFLAEK